MRRVFLVVGCASFVMGFAAAARAQETGASAPTAQMERMPLTAATVAEGAAVDASGDLFGVGWQGDADATFAFETRRDGVWTPAEEVGALSEESGPDPGTPEAANWERAGARFGTEPLWAGDATAVRVRLVSGNATEIELVAVDTSLPLPDRVNAQTVVSAGAFGLGALAVAGALGRRRFAVLAVVVGLLASGVVVATAEHAEAAEPPAGFVGRKAWGAEPPQCDAGRFKKVRFGIVHHTAGRNTYEESEGPGIVLAIQQYHMHGPFDPPYCDIAYNFLVDKYGHPYVGRAGSQRVQNLRYGAHTSGHNKGSVGVSVLGNYEVTELPAPGRKALADVLAWRFSLHGIDPNGTTNTKSAGGGSFWPAGEKVPINTIVGHRDLNSTQCPGVNIYSQLPRIKNLTAKRIGGA